jgi:acyl-CoA thioesterase-1
MPSRPPSAATRLVRSRSVWTAVVFTLLIGGVVETLSDADAPEPRSVITVVAPEATLSPEPEAGSTAALQTGRTTSGRTTSGRAQQRAPRALFFGDSYFVGHGGFPAAKAMAAVAGRKLGWRFVIRGGGGTGFVAANPEFDLPDYLGQIADGAFDVGARRWVVIEGGSNDYGRDPIQVKRNAIKVLKIAARRFPRARVVLAGPMSADGAYADDRPINQALRSAARVRRVPFIDMMRWLEGRPGLVSSDGVHPTAKGYRVVGTKLARALRQS